MGKIFTDKYEKCSGITFLGAFNGCDLYHSEQMGLPTVIARYGNEGYEYTSGMCMAHGQDLDLTEARRLAILSGLKV